MAKIYKRAMSIILAVMMMLSAIQIAATQVPMIISVSSANSLPGGTVVATVSVSENPGISSMKLSIYYDSRLTLVDATTNLEWGGTQSVTPNLTNPIVINWANPIADCFLDGTFATLTFKVPDDAEENEVYNIGILYDPDDIYNLDETNIECTVINGSITVVNCKAGDINGDQKVNNKDYSRLFQYLTGWNVIVNDSCLDVNGDGKVNNKDYSRLFQYLTGWEVEINCACGSVTKCNHSSMIEVPAVSPTCTADGNRAHWYCSVCGKYFADSLGLAETTLPEITLMATGHSLVVDSEVTATCISTGLTSGTHCDICGDIIFAQETVPVNDNAHSLTDVATCTVSQTCTLCGIVYAEAYGHTSNAGATCTDSEVCVTCGTVITSALGHKYSEEWTTDSQYHWRVCEYGDEIVDKTEHAIESNGKCKTCGYIAYIQLATPIISNIEYDTIYWTPVEGAEYYTVRVNDNYECILRGTECDLADVKNNGATISKYGYVRVEVRANGYTSEDGDVVYKASMWSDIDSSYYYVPETLSSNAEVATRFRIGYGYNLVEAPYLDTKNYASTNSVLNINKLLTIGEYSEAQGTAGVSSGEYYSSIDDFLSKTDISGKFGNEKSSQLIGSLKFQIEAGLDVEYSKHKYSSTYIGSSSVVYNDRRIINFEKENLKYCLSDIFLKDIRRESTATRGMSDEQLMEYLYTTYGTHAILGVNTGGSYVVQYTIATDSEKIAHDVKVGFELSTGGGAVDQIIQKNFNLSAAVEESIQSNESETKVSFVTYFYGGNGSTTTDINEYNATKSTWEVNESNASAIGLTQDGAIAISSLISFIDYDLALLFEKYIDERSDEMYDELYAQYTMPADLNWNVTTENGENILRIDLSAYQKSGSMKNVYSSYVIDNIMTVYPVMAGKDVHKIVIVGAFDGAESRNLIDKFSITLSKKWNRNVNVVIENLGVVAASDAGIVDTSAIRNNINVNIDYSGINVVKQTNGEYQLFAKVNSEIYSAIFDTQDTTDIDLSSARIEAGVLYLPQSFKANYEFGGWYDANGLQVADSTGKLNLLYSDTFNEVRVNAKWNPITYKIKLNNYSATSAGTEEIYELYNVGFYLDYEGNQNIVKIPELPRRTGFVFKGYYAGVTDNATANAKPNGTQYIDESGNILVTRAEFSKNTTIYALWEPDVYTITLDNQGADTSGSTVYYEKYVTDVYLDEDCATTGKITVPTKDGYTFMGYYESVSDNGTAAAKGTGQMIKPDGTIVAPNTQYTANKTLYALWTEPRYEISFDNQGADVSGSTSIYQKTGVGFYQDVNCTTIVPSNKITVPKKTGYTFGGYYEAVYSNNTPNSTGTTQYVKDDGTISVTNTAFTENKILYALWDLDEFEVTWNTIANCSITVTRKSSQWSGAKIGALSSGDTIYYGDKLEVTYTANTGYHFEENGISTSITKEFNVTKNLTANDITAKPIINTYTIVYNGNGNTGGSMSSVVHTYGTAKYLTANSFSRHGWTFTGWKDQNGITYTNGQEVIDLTTKHGDTITLYAQWELITTKNYEFSTFEVNNGISGANGYYVTLTDIFDMESLKNQGYTLHVSMNFTLKDVDAGSDGKYIFGFRVYNGTGDTYPKLYDAGTAEVSSGSHPKNYNSIVNVSCNSLSNNHIGFLFVEDTYALFGVITNRYNVEGLVMTIYFTK